MNKCTTIKYFVFLCVLIISFFELEAKPYRDFTKKEYIYLSKIIVSLSSTDNIDEDKAYIKSLPLLEQIIWDCFSWRFYISHNRDVKLHFVQIRTDKKINNKELFKLIRTWDNYSFIVKKRLIISLNPKKCSINDLEFILNLLVVQDDMELRNAVLDTLIIAEYFLKKKLNLNTVLVSKLHQKEIDRINSYRMKANKYRQLKLEQLRIETIPSIAGSGTANKQEK
jgi:hypothetical protein